MSLLRDLLDEEELGLVLDCMERERKRCKAIHERPIQGYGTATETEKKEQWLSRADEIDCLMTKLSEEYI